MGSVRLEHITKSFDGKPPVVQSLTLSIRDKEFIVLVGPSGCGKSTTLRIVAGLEDATDGEVYIDDKLMNDVPPKDRDIAMVFQNYALYPHMTVFDNLAFGLKMRHLAKTEIAGKVTQTAELLGIRDLLDRKPKALSGGQRQRVALGRAIVRKPKVFLFDEPLSNLDANLRVQMRAELLRLHRRLETTSIYVTHDQVEAMSMGERIVVMQEGIVQQVDTPLGLYNAPVNQFVAAFIGNPTMNFIEGTILGQDGTVFQDTHSSISVPLPPAAGERLRRVIAKDITLGVRPEHIHLASSTSHHRQIDAKIDLVEPVGNETFIHFTCGRLTGLVARIPSEFQPARGTSVQLYIDTSKVHFFDRVTRRSL